MTALESRYGTDVRLTAIRAAAGEPASTGLSLRAVLVGLDIVAVVAGWGLVLAFGAPATPVTALLGVIVVATTIAGIAAHRLYLARVCAIRAVEISRLGKATVTGAIAALLADRFTAIAAPFPLVLAGASAAFGGLVVGRAGFRNWLAYRRRAGHNGRRVVIVGTNDEGADLVHLLLTHPELGFWPVGVVGDFDDTPATADVAYLGPTTSTVKLVREANASGVLIASSGLQPSETNRIVRECMRLGIHVHLSSGIRGISHSRMRSAPLAHEPLFYLEPLSLAGWQLALKRAVDIVLGAVALVLAVPIVIVAAVLIKLDDRGPVFFRQTRVGRHGRPFQILKLRTMRPDAPVIEFNLTNERFGGPLFKAVSDPRRTRVGRWLERLSIDELPQVINVLKGEMSLVGPRPALPAEVAEFDDELKTRHTVLPGITGLWQVEARDNPSFSAYRRYDLFYIENWSMQLDLAILVATMQRVLFRSVAAAIGVDRRAEVEAPDVAAA